MSLIDDALQRAQTTLTKQEGRTTEAPPAARPAPEPRVTLRSSKPGRFGGLTAIALAGVGAGVLGLGWLTNTLWMQRLTVLTTPAFAPSQPTVASMSASLLPTATAAPAHPVRPIPAVAPALVPSRPRVQRAGSFPHRVKLQGVVHGSGESYAIINDVIVRVGDAVEGAKLESVAPDSARLRWRDQDIVLYLDR